MKSQQTESSPVRPGVPAELASQIDELGALEEELKPIAVKLKRAEALRKAIGAKVNEMAKEEESLKIDGKKFAALVGPRKNERFIKSMKQLFTYVRKSSGLDEFLGRCTMPLKHVEELVPASELPNIISESRRGSRSVDTYRKAG